MLRDRRQYVVAIGCHSLKTYSLLGLIIPQQIIDREEGLEDVKSRWMPLEIAPTQAGITLRPIPMMVQVMVNFVAS